MAALFLPPSGSRGSNGPNIVKLLYIAIGEDTPTDGNRIVGFTNPKLNYLASYFVRVYLHIYFHGVESCRLLDNTALNTTNIACAWSDIIP